MRVPRGWLGMGAAAWAAACASPQPQAQRADTAGVAEAATPAVSDSVRRPPAEPMDRRPWVPVTDSLRLRVDTAGAGARPQSSADGWTAGVSKTEPGQGVPSTLRAVRTARNDGWDRVVFEFEGDALPGYHVEYVNRPVTMCGSGEATEVAGNAWLEVRFTPARAHDEQGQVTVADRERKLSLPVLRELELTCDFEADVTWVLGVTSPNRYRVQQLSGPARIVVDVMH